MIPCLFSVSYAGSWGLATLEMCSPLQGGGSVENLDRCAARYPDWMHEHGFIREHLAGAKR